MSKKAFFIILILSLVVTYGVAIVDSLNRNSFLAGEAGVPFRFSSAYFFGESINLVMLLLDIAFWFVVTWMTWKVLQKILKK